MNNIIINEFEKLVKQTQHDVLHASKNDKIKQSFRLDAIKKALDIIKKYKYEITQVNQLKNIPGIGKKTLLRIDEILKTGKLSEIKDEILDQSYLKYINELAELHGISQMKALELYKTYGVKSVEDLKELLTSGKITLPDNVTIGLKYYDKTKEKIPRNEIELIDIYLHIILYEIDIELFGIICGSYRRLNLTSNDIDILIIHPSYLYKHKPNPKVNYLNKFIKKLKQNKFIVDSLTSDDVVTKYMGLCKYENNPIRRIDIRFIPYDSYYSAILYFTGSAEFNKKMRRVADSYNYTLNEYGLFDENNKLIQVSSEKDIFDKLDMDYLSPELRK